MDGTLLSQITDHGFDHIRIDVDVGEAPADHERRWAQIRSLRNWEGFVIFLLGPGHIGLNGTQLVRHTEDFLKKLVDCGYRDRKRFALEIGNEPDLAHKMWKTFPHAMADAFGICHGVARGYFPDIPILSPSISNLIQHEKHRGFQYLEAMAPRLPHDCDIAFHRYPAGRDFEDPHRGFHSRPEEIKRLKEIAGDRKLWCTELGWAEENPKFSLTEDQVAARIGQEIDFAGVAGIHSLTLYGINSAPILPGDNDDAKREKTFGARRADLSWKPWAEKVKAKRASA